MIDGSQDRGVDDRTTPLKGLRRDWTMKKRLIGAEYGLQRGFLF